MSLRWGVALTALVLAALAAQFYLMTAWPPMRHILEMEAFPLGLLTGWGARSSFADARKSKRARDENTAFARDWFQRNGES